MIGKIVFVLMVLLLFYKGLQAIDNYDQMIDEEDEDAE